jgi:hypothetical protein
MNTINVISPYKHHGVWVFDDARVGLAHWRLGIGPAVSQLAGANTPAH